MSAVALESASKRYDGQVVLDTVSIEFPENLVSAVIGPSGCGKSTLLKLLNGLTRPDSGRVLIFGEPLNYDRLQRVRRRLGYAVQGNGLFPHLTARANITLLARLEGWSESDIESRLDTLLQIAQLQRAQLDQYPHQLSGGQQQRVGLCRALMLQPDVLLLDEPFAAIDPITREDIHRQVLAMLAAEPTTTVLVTHDMREAMTLAEHIVVMGPGVIRHSVSKADLARRFPGENPADLLHRLLGEAAP